MKQFSYKNEKTMPLMPVAFGSMDVNDTSGVRNIKPVIDSSKCIKCMICWKFCPDVAVDIIEEEPKINLKYCKGCAICSVECPKNAIEMVVEKK